MNAKRPLYLYLVLALSLAAGLVTLVLSATPVLALPPRPEPTPAPVSASGGAIELRIQGPHDMNWTAMQTLVQWQDGLGNWHDVDSWRGTLDEIFADGGRKTWWVGEEHFGTGPFRWVVDEQGHVLAASVPFTMPASAGAMTRVIVILPHE